MTRVLDNELLRTFVAVAEHGSFTRAAAGLHRTQSGVSMQIRRLEQSLAAQLFERRAAGVALTAAGRVMLGHARQMLALSAQAKADVAAQAAEAPIRIGVMEDYGLQVLQPALARLAAASPPLPVEVVTGLTARLLERLGSEFDLVIAMHPTGQGGGTLLRREQAVWAMAAGYADDSGGPIPLALYPPGCLLRAWAVEALEAARRPWRLSFVGDSPAAVQAVAARGEALTVVKASLFPRRLRRVPLQFGLPRLPAADVRFHRARALSVSAGRLADRLVEQLAAA
jgi:DNA-binding transcriptional LysR family regulator